MEGFHSTVLKKHVLSDASPTWCLHTREHFGTYSHYIWVHHLSATLLHSLLQRYLVLMTLNA